MALMALVRRASYWTSRSVSPNLALIVERSVSMVKKVKWVKSLNQWTAESVGRQRGAGLKIGNGKLAGGGGDCGGAVGRGIQVGKSICALFGWGVTPQVSDPAPSILECKPERHRRVRSEEHTSE